MITDIVYSFWDSRQKLPSSIIEFNSTFSLLSRTIESRTAPISRPLKLALSLRNGAGKSLLVPLFSWDSHQAVGSQLVKHKALIVYYYSCIMQKQVIIPRKIVSPMISFPLSRNIAHTLFPSLAEDTLLPLWQRQFPVCKDGATISASGLFPRLSSS